MSVRHLTWVMAAVLMVGAFGCIKLDFFLFAGDEADLEDYDFTSEDLDGVDPERITSELIPVGSGDDQIHVVFIERDLSKLDPRLDPEDEITVVYSHGNRGNLALYWHRLTHYEDMGFNVLFYDYRGYGASTGETTEENTYEDAETAYDYARARDDVGEILSVGFSMGGGPGIWLCSPESEREVFACFIESAFNSTKDLLEAGFGSDMPSSWIVDVAYENGDRAATVEIPFLLMHGELDDRVAFDNARQIWSRVEGNHRLNRFFPYPDAGHRDVHIPSYPGVELPVEYSHPDELPPELYSEYEVYRSRIVDFVVDALEERE